MTDRLKRIKEADHIGGVFISEDDLDYLISEVERLRQGKQEEAGEWKECPANMRGLVKVYDDRDIAYNENSPLAKALAAYVAAVLNAVQSRKASSKHPVQFEHGVLCGALLTDLYDAMQVFNAGEEVGGE